MQHQGKFVDISDKNSFVCIFYEFEFLNVEGSSIVNARKILNIPPREVLVKAKMCFTLKQIIVLKVLFTISGNSTFLSSLRAGFDI